ncbi:MAG: nuclear transport factor 2 family protein [Acidimicrobiales bacterium]
MNQPHSTSRTRQAEAVTTVQEFLDAYASGDLNTASALVADDLTYRIPGNSRIAGTHHGRSALQTLATVAPRRGARQLASSTDQLIATTDGATVVTFHTLTGLLDNKPIELESNLRFDLDDGRIRAITEYTHHPHETDELFAPEYPRRTSQ